MTAAVPKILVVEDNVDAAASLAEYLQMFGHEVRTSGDGPEALATLDSFLPEVVLLDLGLPGMDGYELADRLRTKHPAGASLRIIAVSGADSPTDQRRSKAAGFEAHVGKPVDLRKLRTLLGSATVPTRPRTP